MLVAGGEADGFALLCGLLLGADELVVLLDAVDLVCLLFACGHVGFFLLGGVGAPYRYGFVFVVSSSWCGLLCVFVVWGWLGVVFGFGVFLRRRELVFLHVRGVCLGFLLNWKFDGMAR